MTLTMAPDGVVSGRDTELAMLSVSRAGRLAGPLIFTASVIFAGGCASARPGPDGLLTQAGFRAVPATTPPEVAHLRTLPAHRVVERTKNGKPYYVYADPDQCTCLYLGDASAYAKYRALAKQPQDARPPREMIDWELGACCK